MIMWSTHEIIYGNIAHFIMKNTRGTPPFICILLNYLVNDKIHYSTCLKCIYKMYETMTSIIK